MREILFQGKRVDNDEWVEGDLDRYITPFRPRICRMEDNLSTTSHEVDPETVRQYKGIDDKNKKKIFDKDICIYSNSEGEYGVGVIEDDYVKWISGNLYEKHIMTPLFYFKCGEEWEVIGNIFDSPNLFTTSSTDSD